MTHAFPTTETRTRYEEFRDGRVAEKKRRMSLFEFENGKVALYDFDSEQYRSPIRRNTLKIQGVRGEVIDGRVYYLDGDNAGREGELRRESGKISFGDRVLLQVPYSDRGLSDDEIAIATLMRETGDYAGGLAPSPYPLQEALQDAYMALKMQEAEDAKASVTSGKESWM